MTWRDDAAAHAIAEAPREACGLLVLVRGRIRYRPCRNIAEDPEQHAICHPEDRCAAEDAGAVVGFVHSHPDGPDEASADDIAGCDADGIAWHILTPGGWTTIRPAALHEPLLGREFVYGSADCYGLIRAWYAQVLNIYLPDFHRAEGDFLAGRDLYGEGFPLAGFAECRTEPQPGDVLLFRLAAPVPDHGAIYLGGDRILHHLQGRLSSRDDWAGFLRERTVKVLRYVATP